MIVLFPSTCVVAYVTVARSSAHGKLSPSTRSSALRKKQQQIFMHTSCFVTDVQMVKKAYFLRKHSPVQVLQ